MAYENKWVAKITSKLPPIFKSITLNGIPSSTSLNAKYLWTDGDNLYYSQKYMVSDPGHYKFNPVTSTWEELNWTDNFYGDYVWTNGVDIFYDYGEHKVFNKTNLTWENDPISGRSVPNGNYVWYDNDNVYYSYNNRNYVYDKTNDIWVYKTWNGISSSDVDARFIWSDGTNIYMSWYTNHYVLDRSSSTWNSKSWSGLTNFYGYDVWTDGENIYYSDESSTKERILDKTNSRWNVKTWNIQIYSGKNIKRINDKTYYFYKQSSYVLYSEIITDIPYRQNFPELKESIPARWLIDNDIPFWARTPNLIESKDFRDLWLTETDPDIPPTPASVLPFATGYRYVKVEFDVTIAMTTDYSVYTADITLPNTEFYTSQGYSSYQKLVKVKPKTPVPSRCYGAEFQAYLDPGFDTYYTTFTIRLDKGYDTSGRYARMVSFDMSGFDSNYFNYTEDPNVTLYNPNDPSWTAYDKINEMEIDTRLNYNNPQSTPKSVRINCKLYYCFDSDEAGYDALLAAYPNNATPYTPGPPLTPTKVPFRADFSELIESIPGPDMWFIDDDIPFRVEYPELKESMNLGGWLIDNDVPFRHNYPPLIESVGTPKSWLQTNGYEPYRPWPNHKTIFQTVEPVEVPSVDWSKGMQQTFEYYTVDPNTWYDVLCLTNIISCSLTHDSSSEMRGHASITTSEPLDENYIRIYMRVRQNGINQRFCLGTYLFIVSSDSFNGKRHSYTYTGYTPLIELKEKLAPLGYNVIGITGEKPELLPPRTAPTVTDEISRVIWQYSRLKLENNVLIERPLLNNFVSGTSDTWLAVVNNLLTASTLQQYELAVDNWGAVRIKEAITVYNEKHVYEYDDGNSSILLPTLDLTDDMTDIPNVVEVIYTGNGNKDIGYVRKVVKNEDTRSIVSVPSRGREIWRRFVISNIAMPLGEVTRDAIEDQVEAQAKRLLEAASTIRKTIQYSHGFNGVEVGDTVLFNYERAGFTGIKAKVVSQTINCKPGCQVDETAVYTKRLWNRN